MLCVLVCVELTHILIVFVFTELFEVEPERVCRELGDLEIDGDLEKIGVFVLVTVNVSTPDLVIVVE